MPDPGHLQFDRLSSRLEGPFGSFNLLGALIVSFSPFDPWPDWLAAHVPISRRAGFLAEIEQAVIQHSQKWITELTEKWEGEAPAEPRTNDQHSSAGASPSRNPYLRRVERCLLNHWERFADGAKQLPSAEHVLARLERGDLGYERPQSNVIREIILAQALEQHEARAAELFEEEFMPTIRHMARRTAGDRGLDLVENFAADLMLPRETRPPRIAGYLGKTSLASWLRVVVTNHCHAAGRHDEPVQSLEDFDPAGTTCTDSDDDQRGCEGLLQPIFKHAVSALESEDRLLIKLLILEEVPQNTLAERLGIHSGNVTRRRQRISQTIWSSVERLRKNQCVVPDRVTHCLELVLSGNDSELRRSLGQVLATALTIAEDES